MKTVMLIAFAMLGALFGWLDPRPPEHMTPMLNICAGIVAGLVAFVLVALFLKEASDHEQTSKLMHECYLGGSEQY